MGTTPAEAGRWPGRYDLERSAREHAADLQPPPPDALVNAQRALAWCRREHPALVAWVEEGAPTLTEEEHVARFGCAYGTARRRRAGRAG